MTATNPARQNNRKLRKADLLRLPPNAAVTANAAARQQVNSHGAANLLLQRKCGCGGSAGISGQCEDCQLQALLVGASRSKLSLQKKLSVGNANDRLEQEADDIAAQVMQMRPPRQAGANGRPSEIHRKLSRANSQSENEPAPAVVHQVLNRSGIPLDQEIRDFMEPRFGIDFDRVRVHNDGMAALSAQVVAARAYTVGNHIVFNQGKYAPHTDQGKTLIAHELSHVVQQSGSSRIELQRSWDGFWNDFGRGFVSIFTDEPDYDNQVLTEYLKEIDRRKEIIDDYDSDNKARAVVSRWQKDHPDFQLTPKLKILLIKEMLSGITGDPDEDAILALMQGSNDLEIAEILAKADEAKLREKIDGDQYDTLDSLIAAHKQRVASGNAITKTTTKAKSNSKPGDDLGIDKRLANYLRHLDTKGSIRRGPDSHRNAREVIKHWQAGDERYFMPPVRKQLLLEELMHGNTSAEDQDAMLTLLRGADDAELGQIVTQPFETKLKASMDSGRLPELESILQDWRKRHEKSQLGADKTSRRIRRIEVNQEIPQKVTVFWNNGGTDTDICSTGKGHCCVDADDAQGAASTVAGSHQGGSNLTPIGTHTVDYKALREGTQTPYWTSFQKGRGVALHKYEPVDGTPLSHGCVRLNPKMAKLIYEGSVKDQTQVKVKGLARPRCNWPALKREWAGDFRNASFNIVDGESPEALIKIVKRQREKLQWAFNINDNALTERLNEIEKNHDIPRCFTTKTDEEQRLQRAEPQEILKNTKFERSIAPFKKALKNTFSPKGARAVVKQRAKILWNKALKEPDDRALYWARLAMIQVIRQWKLKKTGFGRVDDRTRLRTELVDNFDQHSHGMPPSAFPHKTSANPH